jgi:hypothetical protein
MNFRSRTGCRDGDMKADPEGPSFRRWASPASSIAGPCQTRLDTPSAIGAAGSKTLAR